MSAFPSQYYPFLFHLYHFSSTCFTMKTFGRLYIGFHTSLTIATSVSISVQAERSDSRLWLPTEDSGCRIEYKGTNPNALKAVEILSRNAPDNYFHTVSLIERKKGFNNKEAFSVTADSVSRTVTVTAPSGEGLLYGALSLYRPASCYDRTDAPRHSIRVLNHWDNLDGTIERGYAGHSIWNWDTPLTEQQISLYRKYALANAMAGINGTVLNNVNASPNMLTPKILERVAEIADIFRAYGIKLYL